MIKYTQNHHNILIIILIFFKGIFSFGENVPYLPVTYSLEYDFSLYLVARHLLIIQYMIGGFVSVICSALVSVDFAKEVV